MTDRSDLRELLRVKPGTKVKLDKIDPAATHGWTKESAAADVPKLYEDLANLQDRLWAEQKRGVLVVLQGIDASGKDGTIKATMTAMNPQGVEVASFKVPSAEEAGHDFLWRIHQRTPARGYI